MMAVSIEMSNKNFFIEGHIIQRFVVEGEVMNENREEDSFIRPQCCSRSLPPKLNVGSDDYVTFTNYKAAVPHTAG